MPADLRPNGPDHAHEDDFKPLAPAEGEAAAAAAPAPEEEEPLDAGQSSLTRALNQSFVLLKALMLVVIVLFFLDCAQQMHQTEVGVVKRFGAYLTDGTGALVKLEPGRYHLIWPEPIEKLERVSLAKRDLVLDSEFWTSDAARKLEGGELPAARDAFDPATDGYNLTGDLNLLHTRWEIEYQIDKDHPEDYLLATRPAAANATEEEKERCRPERLLRAVATSVILRNVAGMSTDDVLIRSQPVLRQRVLEEIVREMRDPATGRPVGGMVVTNVMLAGAKPPTKVKEAFDQVIQAISQKKTRTDDAEREARGVREAARATASQIVESASVVSRETVEYAKADAGRITALLEQFKGNPEGLGVALEQVRLDHLSSLMASSRLITLPSAPKNGQHVIMVAPAQETPGEK